MADNNFNLINERDANRSWLHDFTEKILSGKREAKLKDSRACLSKYADFICQSCSKMFTKDFAINQLQGICDQCGTQIVAVAEIEQQVKQQEQTLCECAGCGKEYIRANLKKGFKCECGHSKFIAQGLISQVKANTEEFIKHSGLSLGDGGIWHKGGTIFADLIGQADDGSRWNAVVAASGQFTRDDVLVYKWTPKGGEGAVLTATNDPFVKFARNEKCSMEWQVEDSFIDPDSIVFKDVSGRDIRIGSHVEWRERDGMPVRGIVRNANKESFVVGIIQDKLGKTKSGTFAYDVNIGNNDIQQLGLSVY